MEFLTKKSIELNKAGYLVSKESKKPVFHSEFVRQQQSADYIVRLASAIKDKNFTPNAVDSIEAIKAEVRNSIYSAAVVKYVDEPAKLTSKVNDELVQFALDFVKFEENKSKSDKVNEFMQQFNSINDVETVGEYFSEGLVKLNKIYTIAEILEAVQINVEKLG
jgi:hypothetical protein